MNNSPAWDIIPIRVIWKQHFPLTVPAAIQVACARAARLNMYVFILTSMMGQDSLTREVLPSMYTTYPLMMIAMDNPSSPLNTWQHLRKKLKSSHLVIVRFYLH